LSREQWTAFAGPAWTTGRDDASTGAVAPDEVAEVYAPLAALLARLAAADRGPEDGRTGPAHRAPARPFVTAIAGGVAVGKSTTAEVLAALIRRGPGRPTVEVLASDAFLLPNAELERRGLVGRKGFPETYDHGRLRATLDALRSGAPEVSTPVYSHRSYDIVPGAHRAIRHPDFLIVEGLHLLADGDSGRDHVSPFDLTVYVDAAEDDVARWFTTRLFDLRSAARHDPGSFYSSLVDMDEADVAGLAQVVWREINLVNLRHHVEPSRRRACLILSKGADHRVRQVHLRWPRSAPMPVE
jgi:type I pantothenate kinase